MHAITDGPHMKKNRWHVAPGSCPAFILRMVGLDRVQGPTYADMCLVAAKVGVGRAHGRCAWIRRVSKGRLAAACKAPATSNNIPNVLEGPMVPNGGTGVGSKTTMKPYEKKTCCSSSVSFCKTLILKYGHGKHHTSLLQPTQIKNRHNTP